MSEAEVVWRVGDPNVDFKMVADKPEAAWRFRYQFADQPPYEDDHPATVFLGEDQLTTIATWWLKHNPSLLRSLLSPEQVEALEWALLGAYACGKHDHADAIKSLLIEEADRG